MMTCPLSRDPHDRLCCRKKKTWHRQNSTWRSRPVVFSLLPSCTYCGNNCEDDLVPCRIWRLVSRNPERHRQQRCLRMLVHMKKSSEKSLSLITYGACNCYVTAWSKCIATYKSGSKQIWRRIFSVWNHIAKAQTDRTKLPQLSFHFAKQLQHGFSSLFFFRFRLRSVF